MWGLGEFHPWGLGTRGGSFAHTAVLGRPENQTAYMQWLLVAWHQTWQLWSNCTSSIAGIVQCITILSNASWIIMLHDLCCTVSSSLCCVVRRAPNSQRLKERWFRLPTCSRVPWSGRKRAYGNGSGCWCSLRNKIRYKGLRKSETRIGIQESSKNCKGGSCSSVHQTLGTRRGYRVP